jgi:outer membrane lipoprotein-sorting protein
MSSTMQKSHRTNLLHLHADDQDAAAAVSDAVDAALAATPTAPRLHVTMDGERLPAETMAALIAGLRRLRERGGAIEVVPGSRAVRDALALTGLNRVFAFPLVPSDPAPRARRLGGLVKNAAAVLVGALALAGLPALASAPAPADPSAILAKVIERNPSLSSYQGRLHVDLRLTSFPYFRQHLDATTYYKRPSNYEVVFDRVPSYAKGFEKLFADVGDPSSWQKRFAISYEGESEFRGHKVAQLRLVQKVRGMIDHETVLVDPAAGTVDQIRYDYYNGGRITMTQSFANVGGYTMLAGQDADIDIPHVRAVAHGDYADYKTNVAVDDAVFTKKN